LAATQAGFVFVPKPRNAHVIVSRWPSLAEFSAHVFVQDKTYHVQILSPYQICLCMLLDLSQTLTVSEDEEAPEPEKVSLFLLKKINVRLSSLLTTSILQSGIHWILPGCAIPGYKWSFMSCQRAAPFVLV
jgi:hypothetical protein